MEHSHGRGLRIAGIPVDLPWSSAVGVLLLTWLFAPGFSDAPGAGPREYAIAAVFAVLVYLSILVHELAHAAAARGFGYQVHQIRLYALGGYTAYERGTPTPGREVSIALAGPAATLVVAVVCWAAGALAGAVVGPGSLVVELLMRLAWVSVLLAVYNLLPGLPLDGGSVVKCAVWRATGSEPAGTRVAAYAGFVVAAAVFVAPFALAWRLGLEAPDMVTVVAIAIFAAWLAMGALDALRRSAVQQRLPHLVARRLARTAIGVPRDLPLSEALRQMAGQGAGALVVIDPNGWPVAIAHDAAVGAVPAERRPWVSVGSVSRSLDRGDAVPADLGGEDLLHLLAGSPAPAYLVVEADGRLCGVLTMDDVHAALGSPS